MTDKDTKDDKRRLVTISVQPGESEAAAAARAITAPITRAALTLQYFGNSFDGTSDLELMAIIGEMERHAKAVHENKLDHAETMLMAQATTLDAVFNNLARRGALNLKEYPEMAETFLKLAFRAQGQCRATLETLGAIKNPPNVAFVKQANIANQQQVNNGLPARAGENEMTQSRLLEDQRGERMDTRATAAAIRGGQALATVAALNRPEDARGKSQGSAQRIQGRRTPRLATPR